MACFREYKHLSYDDLFPQQSVGGAYLPVVKLELLAPYLGLAILLVVIIVSVVYVKRRKRELK